ncbi:hypothetical protein DQ04_00681110 [Trypanosoma grayi]|uniref:hypothetical protein n=1 Tax=Trypanosoma grayi TaxID=71804 RepID=UPI0004F43D7F|nr:hypothetical protein DQ04_00681110 [Trypanosoma grayi]KEG13987.1 hypothetical protein DQ04_00681110 [Trypanosoma grayi]
MQTGASARLRRRLPAGALFASSACCSLSACLSPSRRVHGGAGKGDLLYMNPESQRHGNRALGVARGLRHASQATSPESGQLHYRKLMLHALPDISRAGAEQHCHAACTWAYLLPSLLRCSELAITAVLWDKLCQMEVEERGGQGEKAVLTRHELHRVQSGQDLFRYELHQRLPLLEESVVSADLQQLLGFFYAARRAWIRLPTTMTSSDACHVEDVSANSTQLTRRACSLPCGVFSRCTDGATATAAVARDVTPGRHQIYDTELRVAQLTDVVVARAYDELAHLSSNSDESKPKGVRLLAKEKRLHQSFVEELRWHHIPIPPSSCDGILGN